MSIHELPRDLNYYERIIRFIDRGHYVSDDLKIMLADQVLGYTEPQAGILSCMDWSFSKVGLLYKAGCSPEEDTETDCDECEKRDTFDCEWNKAISIALWLYDSCSELDDYRHNILSFCQSRVRF